MNPIQIINPRLTPVKINKTVSPYQEIKLNTILQRVIVENIQKKWVVIYMKNKLMTYILK